MQKPPIQEFDFSVIELLSNPELQTIFKKSDEEYLYWDKLKYITPKGYKPEQLWSAIKLRRASNSKTLTFGKFRFSFFITESMQALLHEFDLNLGGNLGTVSTIPEKDHQYYLVNSIMEEAIASSQMEGASTTRRVAKDMLRKKSHPQNKSQQMILNNYSTIRMVSENQGQNLSVEMLCDLHKSISQRTLDSPDDEGRIRQDDNIYVMDGITGDIAHTPPSHTEIEELLQHLCLFANTEEEEGFIHPIVKGIIIHFLLAFIHPFVDGNGRTARSLFYWYMLRKKYWLIEYLSISRIIYQSKRQYEDAFSHAENDGLDISYFILYNLQAIKKSYEALKTYLQKKIAEHKSFVEYFDLPYISNRQSQILQILVEKPHSVFTARELTNMFGITAKTARTDLQGLVALGLLKEKPLNQRTVAYIKTDNYDEVQNEYLSKVQ